ncbi:MAG TPA: TonB-dependent receptor [Allosphingosinicella sp.]|nr:TonB-dependent receptor [Allosphingosinicella sp.]
MRARLFAFLCAASLLPAAPAAAQNIGESEIIVTGSRIPRADFDSVTPIESRPPAIGLKRVADFAVQVVTIVGDTRDEQKRRDEIFGMVRKAIELAGKRGGIELATGQYVVEPLTLANYRNLEIEEDDDRDDVEQVSFLVKTRLSAGMDAKAALERIEAFVKAVPAVGRAEMEKDGDLTLSVVGPDQYRAAILDLVAADARAASARLGPAYAVRADGLDRPVEWTRASLTEVYLYVPYSYSVVPAR